MATKTEKASRAGEQTEKQVERGRFVWHELMTTDIEASKAFYKQVIGWNTQKWEAQNDVTPPEYTMWMAGERPVGGLMRLPDEAKQMGAPPHWMAYVSVPDVDATVKKARSLGANVFVEPETIPEVGRFAVMADPDGAVFAVMAPEGPYKAEGDPEPLRFSWHELYAKDWMKAEKFYAELFGWKKQSEMDMGKMGTYYMFGRDRFTYGGMMNKPAEMKDVPPNWLHYVLVDSADAAAERATKAGGKVIMGPMDVPGDDRIAMLIDPQGAAFAVHSKGPQHKKS